MAGCHNSVQNKENRGEGEDGGRSRSGEAKVRKTAVVVFIVVVAVQHSVGIFRVSLKVRNKDGRSSLELLGSSWLMFPCPPRLNRTAPSRGGYDGLYATMILEWRG
ncbi:hypothetical protein BKA70DRAFT_1240346 [Coprinopsis sp. MPI-PUGE-AT-0042]|nr:hypothetical protein BKA70DRAFT_1240346 [Coprinopsis sp. MPI-PUGE-AT-0042]